MRAFVRLATPGCTTDLGSDGAQCTTGWLPQMTLHGFEPHQAYFVTSQSDANQKIRLASMIFSTSRTLPCFRNSTSFAYAKRVAEITIYIRFTSDSISNHLSPQWCPAKVAKLILRHFVRVVEHL